MRSHLHFSLLRVILPAEDDQEAFSWHGLSAQHVVVASGEDSPVSLPTADSIEAILPASRVSLSRLSLPARTGKHLNALVAQTMDDRLLGDRSENLYLVGPYRDEQRQICTCNRRWLTCLLDRLASGNVIPGRLLPVYALLSGDTRSVVYAAIDDSILFRMPDGRYGVVGDEISLMQLIGDSPKSAVPEPYSQAGCEDAVFPIPRTPTRSALGRFDGAIWRKTVGLLALSLVLYLISTAIYWRQLERREKILQHEIRQSFATAFPGTPIVDPVLQWESKRREASQIRPDAFDAITKLAETLALPLQPRNIEVDSSSIRLTLPEAVISRYRTKLEAQGAVEFTAAGPGLIAAKFARGK